MTEFLFLSRCNDVDAWARAFLVAIKSTVTSGSELSDLNSSLSHQLGAMDDYDECKIA